MSYAISPAGLALIRKFEGFCAQPVRLPSGDWLVGHGHLRSGEPGAPVTRVEAAELLKRDLAPVERVVNALVSKPLTQSQFDALASFVFSIGVEAFAGSQVLRKVNGGDFVAAACAMDAWRKAELDGEEAVVDALVRRRAAEKALFLKNLPSEPAPSAQMRAKLDHAAAILATPVKHVGAVSAAAPAKFVASNVVALARSKRAPASFEPAKRLTEILKSEPATEALLSAQPANDFDFEDDDEIVTAHAKPVARPLDRVREATRKAYAAQQAEAQGGLAASVLRRLSSVGAIGNVGLVALLLLSLALTSLGGVLLSNGSPAAAAAVVAPALAAGLAAAYGLWRASRPSAP